MKVIKEPTVLGSYSPILTLKSHVGSFPAINRVLLSLVIWRVLTSVRDRPFKNFFCYVVVKMTDQLTADEFLKLEKVNKEESRIIGGKNQSKNQYEDLLPYDRTLITLSDEEYINASDMSKVFPNLIVWFYFATFLLKSVSNLKFAVSLSFKPDRKPARDQWTTQSQHFGKCAAK